MINIERLHQVHKYYPNVPRRLGKTIYCYDSLLRASETGAYRELAYITTTIDFARESFNDFIEFLDKQGEYYQVLDFRTVVLHCSKITFLGESENKIARFDGYIEDYFKDEVRPSTYLNSREERIRREDIKDRMDWIFRHKKE